MIGSEAATNGDERGSTKKARLTRTLSTLANVAPTAELVANDTGLSCSNCTCTPLCEFLFSVFQLKTKAFGFGRSPKCATPVVHQEHHPDGLTTRFEVSMSLTMSSLPFFLPSENGQADVTFHSKARSQLTSSAMFPYSST